MSPLKCRGSAIAAFFFAEVKIQRRFCYLGSVTRPINIVSGRTPVRVHYCNYLRIV